MKCTKCGCNINIDPYRTVDNPSKVKRNTFSDMKKMFNDNFSFLKKLSIVLSIILGLIIGLYLFVKASTASEFPNYCYIQQRRGTDVVLLGNVEWGTDVVFAEIDSRKYKMYCSVDEKVPDCFSRICSKYNLKLYNYKYKGK